MMLFASLAAAQVTVEGPIPPTTVEGPIHPTTVDADADSQDSPSKSDNGNTMDPAISGCRNKYHVIVPDDAECTDHCNVKLERANYEATIEVDVYSSKLDQGLCCNCNFERTPGIVNGNRPPESDDAGNDKDSDKDSDKDTDDSSPTSGALDPSTFKPPKDSELAIAVDPNNVQTPESKQTNTYAVLRVTGTTGFTTPLSNDYILGFIYAFNNVTGIPFQYKGDAPSIPSNPPQYPAAPNGYPQVKGGPPPPAAPAAADVVAPIEDPNVDATTVPVDPAAIPVVPAPVRRLLRSAPASASRRLSSSSSKIKRKAHRQLLQDTGTGQYLYSPMPGYEDTGTGQYLYSPMPGSEDYGSSGTGDYGSSDTGEYGSSDTGDYGSSDYGNDYSNDYSNDYGSTPSPPPINGNDYSSPSDGDYGNSPSPDIYYQPPSPDSYADDGYGDDDDDAYSSPPFNNYEESPPEIVAPPEITAPPEIVSPPPSPEVIFSPPPAPLGAPLPADADGIWYFSMQPLKDSQFGVIGEALNIATGDGTGDFLKYLNSAGVPATGVELRYYGQATEGEIDLTKKLDGDLFGAASYAPPPADEGSSMSTATIGAIVGGVVAGVVLVAIAGILVASNRRRSTKAEKASLTQRWKTERELGKYIFIQSHEQLVVIGSMIYFSYLDQHFVLYYKLFNFNARLHFVFDLSLTSVITPNLQSKMSV